MAAHRLSSSSAGPRLVSRLVVTAIVIVLNCLQVNFAQTKTDHVHYDPTWESLDARPLPDWYDKAKFGIFVHWGVFSVPSFRSEWFWWYWQGVGEQDVLDFMAKNYPPDYTYGDFASDFSAEFYDPDWWADLFNASGAKYVVLTTKHHEGFALWNTSWSFNWNAMEVGPKRDLVGELATSIRKRTDIHFGVYHSLFEWFNPLFLQDKANGFETQIFPQVKTMPELYELVMTYEPEIVWSDGDASANDTYWTSKDFLAWLYNDSPVKDIVVTNDRWGNGCGCHHGGFFSCQDRYNPGRLQNRKWENAMTIDKSSWGYRREATLTSYLTIEELLTSLVSTVSYGGNLLLNVGPTKDGRIIPIFEERLRQIGLWLSVNGEAIYESVPWTHQNDTLTENIWYTTNGQPEGNPFVYAFVVNWPDDNLLKLGAITASEKSSVTILGHDEQLIWTKNAQEGGIIIQLPAKMSSSNSTSKWVWTLKLGGVDANFEETNF